MRSLTVPTVVLAPALLGAALVLASCGQETAPGAVEAAPAPAVVTPTSVPTAVPLPPGEVTTTYAATVLDDGEGAELCLGGTLDSLPPQCGGPRLLGWDWADHEGDFEDVSGTRWGEFAVTGTFDGTDLTPTAVTPADQFEAPARDEEPNPFTTRCSEPDGGWIVDASLATEKDRTAAFRVANRLDDLGYSYVDTSLDPRSPEQQDEDAAAGADGTLPTEVSTDIVNVYVTEDPAAAEAALREVWGGGLCVGTAETSQKELRSIQRETQELPGWLGSGTSLGVAQVSVIYDDGTIAAWLDREYGAGAVELDTALVDTE